MFCKTLMMGKIEKKTDRNMPSSGVPTVEMVISTKSQRTKNGKTFSELTYHDVVVYGSAASFIQRTCRRGDTVLVDGENQTEHYKSRDGKEHKRYFVCARHVTKIDEMGTRVTYKRPDWDKEQPLTNA